MQLKNKVTILIPFYNENKSIFATLDKVLPAKNIAHIICVDDGSRNQNYLRIEKEYPQITLLRLPKNQGKSTAILHGLKKVTTEWVFFLDADLKNLTTAQIERATTTILSAGSTQAKPALDMLILRRSNYSAFVTAIRHDILMSGERILRTADALEVFKKPPHRYQLEIAINLYMMQLQKKCYWQQTQLVNSYKISKWSLFEALKQYKNELLGYVTYAGFIAYGKQLIHFCKSEYPKKI